MDAGHGAVVHGFLDFFLRRTERIVDHRLVLMVAAVALGFLHTEYFGADLGTGFAADAGILVDNGNTGHDEFLSFGGREASKTEVYGLLYYLGRLISRNFSRFQVAFFASPCATSVLCSGAGIARSKYQEPDSSFEYMQPRKSSIHRFHRFSQSKIKNLDE
jgi:hypothetical protein